MSQKYKGGSVFCRCLRAVISCSCHGLSCQSLCHSLLVLIDHSRVRTNLTQKGFSHCHGCKLILISFHSFHQLIIFCAVHQMGGLYNQILHAVCHRALQRLFHIVNGFSVPGLHMVNDNLSCESPSHRPIRISLLQRILNRLDVFHAAVVEGCAEAYDQKLILADFILIAGIVQRCVAGIPAEIIRICILTCHQLFLRIRQSVPGFLCRSALCVRLIRPLLDIDRVNQRRHIVCRFLIRNRFRLVR